MYLSDSTTIGSIISKAIGEASTGAIDFEKAIATSEEAATNVRRLVTGELTRLLDRQGEARDWNDAIETAIQRVEDLS